MSEEGGRFFFKKKPAPKYPKLGKFAQAIYSKTKVAGYNQQVYYNGEAILYTPVSPKGEKPVLSFRGTTASLFDVATDVGIVTGRRFLFRYATPYGRRMKRMEKVAKEVVSKYGRDGVYFTGHSLGGHIAEVLACKYKVRAVVYNKGSFFTKTCPEVTSIRTKGDLVSMFGRNQHTIGRFSDPLSAHAVSHFEGGHWKGFDWIGRQLKTASKAALPLASLLGPEYALAANLGSMIVNK